jgi:hypothetical protein
LLDAGDVAVPVGSESRSDGPRRPGFVRFLLRSAEKSSPAYVFFFVRSLLGATDDGSDEPSSMSRMALALRGSPFAMADVDVCCDIKSGSLDLSSYHLSFSDVLDGRRRSDVNDSHTGCAELGSTVDSGLAS